MWGKLKKKSDNQSNRHSAINYWKKKKAHLEHSPSNALQMSNSSNELSSSALNLLEIYPVNKSEN